MKEKQGRMQDTFNVGTSATLLHEATNEQTAAKIGIFGDTGSGKTTTGGLLASGLSLTYCKGQPVAMMDTERAGIRQSF